jgi:hypothetical protein
MQFKVALEFGYNTVVKEAAALHRDYGLSAKEALRQIYTNELSKIDSDALALGALKLIREQIEAMSPAQ